MEVTKKDITKKLDLTELIKGVHPNETGENFCTIKKLDKMKRQYLGVLSAQAMTKKEIEDMAYNKELDDKEMIVNRLTLPKEEAKKLYEAKEEYQRFCIENGLCVDNHSFYFDGKLLELNYETLNDIDDSDGTITNYIVNEISNLSYKKKL